MENPTHKKLLLSVLLCAFIVTLIVMNSKQTSESPGITALSSSSAHVDPAHQQAQPQSVREISDSFLKAEEDNVEISPLNDGGFIVRKHNIHSDVITAQKLSDGTIRVSEQSHKQLDGEKQ